MAQGQCLQVVIASVNAGQDRSLFRVYHLEFAGCDTWGDINPALGFEQIRKDIFLNKLSQLLLLPL